MDSVRPDGGLACQLNYNLQSMSWTDEGENLHMSHVVLAPRDWFGAEGHASFFHTDLSLAEPEVAEGMTTNRSMLSKRRVNNLRTGGICGADVLDVKEYDPELDLVLGLGGGFCLIPNPK